MTIRAVPSSPRNSARENIVASMIYLQGEARDCGDIHLLRALETALRDALSEDRLGEEGDMARMDEFFKRFVELDPSLRADLLKKIEAAESVY